MNEMNRTEENVQHGPWEEYQRESPLQPNKKNWAALRESFRSDPLAFVDDPQTRTDMAFHISMQENPELEKKKWALAAYYARMRKEDIRFTYGNLDTLIEHYEGKNISVHAAYYQVAELLHPDICFFGDKYEKELIFTGMSFAVLFLIGIIMIIIRYILKYRSALKGFNNLLLLTWVSDLLLLIIALINATNHNLPYGYYTFLRIVTCGLFVWLAVLYKSPYWRFILGAGAILYNPVFPIHLDSRDPWIFFNILSIVVLVPAFILYIKTAEALKNKEQS